MDIQTKFIGANYTDREACNGYIIAKAKNGMHYIFDADGNMYRGSIFSSRERAKIHARSLDARERFISTYQSRR